MSRESYRTISWWICCFLVAWAACFWLTGCAHRPPAPAPIRVVEAQRVEVPVPVRREPPAELVAPYRPDSVPAFVEPSDPSASSALTPEGERQMRALLNDLMARDEAWRRWATEPASPAQP